MTMQNLPGLHSGVKATLIPGDTMSRSMGQYGKGHSMAAQTAALPDMAPHEVATVPVRDGKGGIKKNPKEGEMGPGPNDGYGTQGGYGVSGDNS